MGVIITYSIGKLRSYLFVKHLNAQVSHAITERARALFWILRFMKLFRWRGGVHVVLDGCEMM